MRKMHRVLKTNSGRVVMKAVVAGFTLQPMENALICGRGRYFIKNHFLPTAATVMVPRRIGMGGKKMTTITILTLPLENNSNLLLFGRKSCHVLIEKVGSQ